MSVRMAVKEDLPQILEIYAPYVLETAVSFEYTVPTLEEFTVRFQNITKQFPWLVWEEQGKIWGYAYASAPFTRAAYQWCAAASIYLHPQVQGKGIGKRLYQALEEILTIQGYRKLYAVVTTANEASVAFHQAVGYTHLVTFSDCGVKFGKLYGTVWLEKDLNTVGIPSSPPICIDEIVRNDENLTRIFDKMPLS